MRAFLSFLIVFAAFAIILIILSASTSVRQLNLSKSIEIERSHAIQMNIKELIIESTRLGANIGLIEYLEGRIAEAKTLNKPVRINEEEARIAARKKSHEYLKNIIKPEFYDNSDVLYGEDLETKIWCGFVDGSSLDRTKNLIFKEKKTLVCDNCLDISDDKCEFYIHLNTTIDYKSLENLEVGNSHSEISFYRESSVNFGVVGISSFSKKFNIAMVSYIPTSEVSK